MALTGQDLSFFFTVASGHNDVQGDPNQSLGGFRASTRLDLLESTLTAAQTDARRLVDTGLIGPPAAGSPNNNSLDTNFGNYNGAANLRHWFRPGHQQRLPTDPEFGLNFGLDTTHDLSQADLNLTIPGDFGNEQPGQFNGARQSYLFTNTANEYMQSNSANIGIADNWTILVWLRPENNLTGLPKEALSIGSVTNRISIGRNNAEPHVVISDSSAAIDRKDYRVQDAGLQFTLNNWFSVIARWDGTTLDIFVNGTLATNINQFEDDLVTMAEAARQIRFGSSQLFASREWDGYIHSCAVWDTNLSTAAITELEAFGDGPVPPDPVQPGDYVAFVTGNNAINAKRVTSFDSGSGEILFLDDPWPNLGGIGDVYRVFRPNQLYDAITPGQSVTSHVDHRAIVLRNDMGVAMTDFRWYIEPLDPGPTILEMAAGSNVSQDTFQRNIDTIADEETLPDLFATSNFTNDDQFFLRPLDYAGSTAPLDFNQDLDLANGGAEFIWLRRTITGVNRTKTRCAFLVVVEGTDGGGDPDPIRSCFVVTFEVSGFAANVSFVATSLAFIGGGTSLEIEARDLATNIPLVDIPVQFSIVSGPGSLVVLPNIVTDTRGKARATYLSPTDEADAGMTVTFQAEVN